jgi:hypothetical protein
MIIVLGLLIYLLIVPLGFALLRAAKHGDTLSARLAQRRRGRRATDRRYGMVPHR